MSGAPTCPRCGYDQSGAIAAWERNEPAQCPLEGVCTECGLKFLWSDVFSQTRAQQTGTFEHSSKPSAFAFVRTFIRSTNPSTFWRWFDLSFHIRPFRLVAFWLTGSIAAYLVFGCVFSAIDIFRSWDGLSDISRTPPYHRMPTSIGHRLANWQDEANPIWWCFGPRFGVGFTAPAALIGLLSFSLMPVAYLFMPVSLRRYQIRWGHICRIAAYGWPWMPALLWLGVLIAYRSDAGLVGDVNDSNRWRWAFAMICVWQVLWWGNATKHYLKISHGWATTILLTILSVAIATGLLVLCWRDPWFWYSL